MEDQTRNHIVKYLTGKHIERYSRYLDGDKVPMGAIVRREEVREYLNLWQNIERKKYEWDELTQVEKQEVLDALEDEGLLPSVASLFP